MAPSHRCSLAFPALAALLALGSGCTTPLEAARAAFIDGRYGVAVESCLTAIEARDETSAECRDIARKAKRLGHDGAMRNASAARESGDLAQAFGAAIDACRFIETEEASSLAEGLRTGAHAELVDRGHRKMSDADYDGAAKVFGRALALVDSAEVRRDLAGAELLSARAVLGRSEDVAIALEAVIDVVRSVRLTLHDEAKRLRAEVETLKQAAKETDGAGGPVLVPPLRLRRSRADRPALEASPALACRDPRRRPAAQPTVDKAHNAEAAKKKPRGRRGREETRCRRSQAPSRGQASGGVGQGRQGAGGQDRGAPADRARLGAGGGDAHRLGARDRAAERPLRRG